MTLRGRGVGAVLAAVLLLGAAGCSGDDGGDDDGDPTSAPTSDTSASEATDGPAGVDPAAGKALCDVLTPELAASVDPALTRQTFSNANQCGYSGKGGAVLLITGQNLQQAGAADEQAFFDNAAAQYGGTLEDLDVGDKGAVLNTEGDGIVNILWTVDHTTYWSLLGTFNTVDDATYDAMVEVAQGIASGA